MDLTLWGGRLGWPLRFLCVEIVIRDAVGMCSDRCGLLSAHLRLWVIS